VPKPYRYDSSFKFFTAVGRGVQAGGGFGGGAGTMGGGSGGSSSSSSLMRAFSDNTNGSAYR
jgi:hypothetical protein